MANKVNKLRLKKNDKVIVTTGRDKGKTGQIVKVIPQENRVVVEGVNIVTVHQKPSQFKQGGLVKKEKSIHVSNVAFLDEKENKPTKVGYKVENGKKIRYAKSSGKEI